MALRIVNDTIIAGSGQTVFLRTYSLSAPEIIKALLIASRIYA
jgi:hypothetical protein